MIKLFHLFNNQDNQILCTGQSETNSKIANQRLRIEKTFVLTLLMSFRAVSFVTSGIELKTDLFF